MAEVTTEMIKDYIVRKGGVVKNVDLVRHFRKYLQQTDPVLKDRAREIFKERVNQIAYIKAEQGEKFLYLKQEFVPAAGLHRPPSGRHPNLSNYDRYSSTSIDSLSSPQHRGPPPPLLPRDSLSQLLTEQTVGSVPSTYRPLSQTTSTGLSSRHSTHSQIANSTQADIVLNSYKPVSSPPPRVTTISPTPPPPTSSSITTSSLFSPPPSSTPSPSPFSPTPSYAQQQPEDSGESLLAQMTAELSNFGSGLGSLFGSLSSPSQPPPSFSPTPPPAPVQPAKPISTTPSLTGPGVVKPVDMSSTSSTSPRRAPPSPPSGSQRPTPVVPLSRQRSPPSGPQRIPPTLPSSSPSTTSQPYSGPQRTPPLPPSGPQRTPPLPPSGPQRTAPLPPSGPQRTPPLPPSGPQRTPPLPPSGPQRTPPLPPSGHQQTPPLPPSGLQHTLFPQSSGPQHAPPSPPFGNHRRPAPPPPTSQPPPPHPTSSAPSSGRRLGPPVEIPNLNGPAPTSSTQGLPRRQGSTEKARDGHGRQGSMERAIMGMGFWGQGSVDTAMDSHKRQGSIEKAKDGHRRRGSIEKATDSHQRQGSMERVIMGVGHRRQGSTEKAVDGHRRQGSVERTTGAQQPGTPGIRIESPTRSASVDSGGSPPNGFSSPIGGIPTYQGSSLNPTDIRGRSHTVATGMANGGTSLGVVLRRDRNSPQDGVKVGRTHSNAGARRSRNLETKTLESITRGSIVMTPPTSRRNKPPTVAPKPSRDQALSVSREDFALEGDDEGSVTAVSESAEGDYYDIDPLEKEWMLATAQSDQDSIHRLMITDPSLVNRRDFIHYTALHWAAKQGRCDIITGLMINGAYVDLKSGFTPLHLAAQAGHDNAILLLVREYGANVDSRDHSGKKPVHMLSAKSSDEIYTLLSMHMDNYSHHQRIGSNHLATFSQPHVGKRSSVHRQWSSVGELYNRRIDLNKPGKKRTSPRMSIRKSFSFRSTKDKKVSPGKKDSKENRRPRIESYNWDV